MNRRIAFTFAALLAPAFVASAAIEPGEVTLGEMNCVACHSADGVVATRLASRQSPRLGADGVRISADWMRAFLLEPQQIASGRIDQRLAVGPFYTRRFVSDHRCARAVAKQARADQHARIVIEIERRAANFDADAKNVFAACALQQRRPGALLLRHHLAGVGRAAGGRRVRRVVEKRSD